MEKPKIKYDEMSDTLSVVIESGIQSLGIELTSNILLRMNPQTRAATSLEFFDYSVLAQTTDIGSRSFPLTGLTNLSKQLQEDALKSYTANLCVSFCNFQPIPPPLQKPFRLFCSSQQ